MKIVPNIKYPKIGMIIESKNRKQYIIDREGTDDVWMLRDKYSKTCMIYKEDLLKQILEHKIKILN